MVKYSIAKVLSLFRKFGGIRLLWAYAKIGVIGTVIKTTLRGVITRKMRRRYIAHMKGM